MPDTVLVTAPDANNAVLTPTLTDAIAAAQGYALECVAARNAVIASQTAIFQAQSVVINAAAGAQLAATNAASSATLAASPTFATGTVGVTQVIRELVILGLFDTAADAIPGSPSDPINAAWNRGGVTQTTGPLMTAIFSAVGYTTTPQKVAFTDAARLHPY